MSDYGLPGAASYSITEDASGAIWIGSEQGVYRFSNGRIEETAKGVAVSVIAITPAIAIAAVGTLGGGIPGKASLVRIERVGKQWKSETVMSLDSPGPLTLDHSGRLLYIWPERGWNELRLDDLVHWRPGIRIPVERHPVWEAKEPAAGPTRVLRDRFGCVWIASDAQDIYNCGGNAWPAAPFEGASVRSDIQEAPDGSMLLSGYNILAVGRPGSFRIAKSVNGLPQLVVALQARDGTLWLGGGQGLYRFASPFRMEYWTARDGVDSPWCVQRNGTDLYACLDRSVGVLTKDRQHWQMLAPFKKTGQVMNLLPANDGNLVAALNGGGAVEFRPDGTEVARTDESPSVYGLRLAKTAAREIWLGGIALGRLTREGRRLNFDNHRLATQPSGNFLDVQYEERTRKLWACYNGGLAERREDGTWREFTTKDGLLANACWSLAALPNGDVWYGYYNLPAFALLHPLGDGRYAIRQFREGDGVRDPESITLDVDRRGWLWRGGNHGLSVADPANAGAGRWLFFDQSDGLSGEGINSGSYFEDSDGSIWFGSDMSLFHYLPPSDLLTPTSAPQIFLSSLSWDGAGPKMAEAVAALPHGSKAVAHIGSLQFDRRSAVRLRYRILPEQSSWRESSSLDLALGSLASGTHTLDVQARVFTGPWSPILRRPLTVSLPVWRTWPWLLLYAITVTLLGAGGYWWRRRRAAEEAELLPDLADWRLRALLPEVYELTGTVLDSRFEVGQLLARGGFANVMEGYDRDDQQRCAIKVFRGEIGDKAWIQRSFEQEVAALEKVHHPNVVEIYARGATPSGAPYLVMEFVEGRTLRGVLDAGPLPPNRTAKLLRQLAGALDAIHGEDVCHRDVKPENVIIRNENSPEEQAVLIDFSIAIVKDANETLYGLSRAAGSFDYMPPEQVLGYAEPSSDIYSLAKLAIEMVAGARFSELLPAATLDLPDRVRKLLTGLEIQLSGATVEALASALEFDPAKRGHVAGHFVHMLVEDLESNARVRGS